MDKHPHPQRFRREFHGLQNSQGWHDDPRHDDVIEATFDALETLLARIEGEAEVPVAQIFALGQARTENVRHNGRFYKQNSHDDSVPVRLAVLVAGKEMKHRSIPYTSEQSLGHHGRSQNCKVCGFQSVNGPIAFIGRFSKKLIIIDAAKDGERSA